jgi:PilZ domain
VQVKEAAPRFSLNLPMRYRPLGDSKWRDAKTTNVSASGLLFEASERLMVGKKLEIEVSMAESLKPTRLIALSEVMRQEKENLKTAVRHVNYRTEDVSA